jgi:uncharacterized protein (TIGR00255 family)
MLKSMTGFGVGRATQGGEEISIELKSLNHKFCEVKVRLPRELSALEPVLAKRVKDRLARGAVEVTVKRQVPTGASTAPVVDTALAKEYRRAFAELAAATGVSDEVPLSVLINQPGVLRMEERSVNLDEAGRATDTALSQALEALTKMREVEGAAIRADLEARLAWVAEQAKDIAVLAPRAIEDYLARLKERVADLSRAGPVDPQRLAQEVALFADRTDVAEEMTRLTSHLAQFKALIEGAEPSGRRMDFLVQEMHREVNTTGSKSQSVDISQRVVALKAELERIREQVQNVE